MINCPLGCLANTYNMLLCPSACFLVAKTQEQWKWVIKCLLGTIPFTSNILGPTLHKWSRYKHIFSFVKPSVSLAYLNKWVQKGGHVHCRVAVKLCKCAAKAGTQQGHHTHRAGQKMCHCSKSISIDLLQWHSLAASIRGRVPCQTNTVVITNRKEETT